jgi:small-conductance mechanosensitive channel
MDFHLKKKLQIFLLIQFFIFIFSFAFYKKISLLSYINISFCVSAGFLLTAMLLYTIQNGFFDTISKSFNMFFSRGHAKRKFADIPSLSEMITINRKPFLFYGVLNALFMVIAIFMYYV